MQHVRVSKTRLYATCRIWQIHLLVLHNGVKVTRLLLLIKLFKFEIQTDGQNLCVHKLHFLMPDHKINMYAHTNINIYVCMYVCMQA